MVKKLRILKASDVQVRQFAIKAEQYRSAMHLAFDSGLWDASVSNGFHAVILMANSLTGRKSGVYFADKDHAQAAEYMKQVLGPSSGRAKEQMSQVLNLKALVEYEAKACTDSTALEVIKRVDRFFSWSSDQTPEQGG
ncbi:MAG: hypothetical protein KKF41_06045 [Actinobacteria bacterium]|nr:hypothetical protein [Actinomycetota bacterium]MBU1944808.1 hypothetical protein [Actinomycetota bacterium]MBU2687125.1 hypothetical protein [Actinomycetota bacterium]